MKFKSTIIIGLLFAALGSYVLFYEILGEEARLEDAENRDRVHLVNFENIRSFELKSSSGPVAGSKSDSGWMLSSPVAYRGDSVYINALLNAFIKAKRIEVVQDSSGGLEQFGFDGENGSMTVVDDSGKNYSIELGNRNPTGRFAYATVPGERSVFLTGAGLHEKMSQESYWFRDKTILDFDMFSVVKLNFHRNGEKYVLERNSSGWNMVSPVRDEADLNTVKNLFTRLQTHKISNFQDNIPEDLKKLGLENPKYQTELVFEDGSAKSLYVGKSSGRMFYMRDTEKSVAYEVDSAAYEQIFPTPVDMRNKEISTFHLDSVSVVELNYPGSRFVFSFDDSLEAWYQEFPVYRRAVNEEIGQIATGIYWARAARFVDKRESLEKYGLGSSAPEIILKYDEEIAAQVRVGRRSGDNVYYYDVLRDRIFLVRSYIYSRLVVPHDQLLWKR